MLVTTGQSDLGGGIYSCADPIMDLLGLFISLTDLFAQSNDLQSCHIQSAPDLTLASCICNSATYIFTIPTKMCTIHVQYKILSIFFTYNCDRMYFTVHYA